MTEKEIDDWDDLKQSLAKVILSDIKENWKAGNIPSTTRMKYEMGITMREMIEQGIRYLKELGEIHIMYNTQNNSDIILEKELVDKIGYRIDQDQKK